MCDNGNDEPMSQTEETLKNLWEENQEKTQEEIILT